ncbi:MAG: hypothetical protein PF518_02425 [Spirochaetaceae bacterium]|jgi:putative transposase|nr:hypothetical protein [Spirochaetaceae bacterium]
MKKRLPNRQSIRLKNYDYTQPGHYFITICTQNRVHLFGNIVQRKMQLNEAGKMVEQVWKEIPHFYKGIYINTMCIMPDHFHAIVTIGAGPRACPYGHVNVSFDRNINETQSNDNVGHPRGGAPTLSLPDTTTLTTLSLPDVVHRFKTMTTKRYIDGVRESNWEPFDKKVWQRNYWERIVRDENALFCIQNYIRVNPLNWGKKKGG